MYYSALRQTSCRHCRMYIELCFCDQSPTLTLQTKIIVFMHWREFRLVTNTGVLAKRLLKNSKIVFRGHPSRRTISDSDILDESQAYILFPSDSATVLDETFLKQQTKPITLICPDGHWGHAKKMLSHEPSLRNLPHVKLPSGLMSNYRLRRNQKAGNVCTFEAISQALGVLEGEKVQETLTTAFDRMVTRLLWTRGKLPKEGVVW